ncbi:MAG: serine hydrolase domain-containing protein [Actinomycetota bacterium]
MSRLDRVVELVRQQVADGQQRGAQLYISLKGDTLLDVGIGTTPTGAPLTPHHLLPWLACTRLLGTVAVLQQWERGRVELDDPVNRYVAGWEGGKQACTIRHLLTHLGGFATIDTSEGDELDPTVLLEQVASAPADSPPGTRATYHRSAAWRVLAEVVRQIDGRPIQRYLREEVWDRVGMEATYLGLDEGDRERLEEWMVPLERVGPTRDGWRGNAGLPPIQVGVHGEAARLDRIDPDLGARGPAHDLGRLLEALLFGGGPILRERGTVTAMTAAQRSGLRDAAFGGHRIPWGLGVMVAGGFAGTVGHRSFGHDGFPGPRALCDPDEGLVLVFLPSGVAGPDHDANRLAAVTDAVYDAVAPRPSAAWLTNAPDELALRG